MSRVRYQVRFTKTGLLRWTSHRDLARLWERLLRRSGLQLAMSEGFHPRPRISFPSALAVGTDSLDEVVELELTEPLSTRDLLDRLESDLSDPMAGEAAAGLRITRVCQVPEGFPKAQLECGHFVLEMPAGEVLDAEEMEAKILRFRVRGTIEFTRKEKTLQADVQTQVVDLAVREGRLEMVLQSSRLASLRPDDVLSALGLGGLIEAGGRLTRVRTELERELDPTHCSVASESAAASTTADHATLEKTPPTQNNLQFKHATKNP